MPQMFLSYRRDDATGVAGRIFDRLVAEYGKESVFMDVDTIPPGTDFRGHLFNVLQQCDLMLAIIGPRWRGRARGKHGRIDEADDYVRLEIETALRRDVRIIPVLVDDTPMPAPAKLPRAIVELASRQAVAVRSGASFHADVDRLIGAIGRRLALTHETTDVIREIRRDFLSAPPTHELIRAKYKLDAYLAKNPYDVDARILQEQIAQAIAYELGREGIREQAAAARKAAATRSSLARALAASLAIMVAGAYFWAGWNPGAPPVQGFALQENTTMEGAELHPGAPAIAVADAPQCAQACRSDADCAAFSFRKSVDFDGRHACMLYRVPVRPVKDERWVSGLRSVLSPPP
jgi:hypothetical protein